MDFKFDNIFEGVNWNPDIVGQTTREINEGAERLLREEKLRNAGYPQKIIDQMINGNASQNNNHILNVKGSGGHYTNGAGDIVQIGSGADLRVGGGEVYGEQPVGSVAKTASPSTNANYKNNSSGINGNSYFSNTDFRGGGGEIYGEESTGSGVKAVSSSTNTSSASSLKLNNDGITQIISSINETISSVNEEWDNIVKNDVNVINNSWASKDAKSYVDKLLTEGNKIKDVMAALKLLSNTYQKVINESENVQQDVQNSINRI